MRISQAAVALAAILALASCGGDSDGATNPDPTPVPTPVPTQPSGNAVVVAEANYDEFSPSEVRIAVGGTVTWRFGARAHNVIFGSAAGAPANIGATTNAQVSRTFPSAGTFQYDCTIHPGMRGRVAVGT